MLALNVGLQGIYTLRAVDAKTGRTRTLGSASDNTITDSGRNVMATRADWLYCCVVGEGSTPTTVLDTSLEQYVTGVNNSAWYSHEFGAQTSPPYFGWRRRTWRFPVGQAAGNLSEVGVGWSNVDGPYLVSRALIVNLAGVPTTVTVLPTEYLDVTYELRYYPPLVDATDTIVLKGITYDVTMRASIVTNAVWGELIGSQIGYWYRQYISEWRAFDGGIGDITSEPSGLNAGLHIGTAALINNEYQNVSYQRDIGVYASTQSYNITGDPGIRSVTIQTTAGMYQAEFSAQGTGDPIPKTTLRSMNLGWRIGFDNYVAP